jgi:putative ABC transport system substrate-binding protein
MNRRAFLGGLAAALVTRPPGAEPQPAGRAPRLGIVAINPRSAPFLVAFEQRLRELGWEDGKNLEIVFRMPRRPEDAPAVAAELVRQNVGLFVAGGPESNLQAVRRATSTIPIVMVALNYDPVAKGYVASVARPGGNITGVWSLAPEQGSKQLELMTELLPKATRIAVLWEAFSVDQVSMIEASAPKLGVQIEKVEVRPPYDLERAFVTLTQQRVGGVLIVSSPIFFRERARIGQLALKHRLAAGGPLSGVDAGLLLGFGVDPSVPYRRAADYVDRILKGSRPADLPIEQPTKYELAINLKSAKALGLTVSPSLLLRADRVVE